MNRIITCLLILLILTISSYSQVQRINGQSITGNQTWRGTILISGDVTIEQKSRLVIEPGTKVLFESNQDFTKGGKDKTRSEIIVRGTLIARGLPGRKIKFSSNSDFPRMGDWYSLEFLHLKGGSLLEYCVIEYAYNGLTIKNSKLMVNNCEVRYNYHAGISTEVKSTPEIKNSILSENGYAGLICELGSKPVLSDNVISLNHIGVVVFSLSQPNLGNMTPGENYNPGRNNIYNNEEFNLYNHSNKKIIAESNYWGDKNRSIIAEKVYDRDDNSKFGLVDFAPILKQSAQENLGTLLLLAQDTGPSKTVPTQPKTKQATTKKTIPTKTLIADQSIPVSTQQNVPVTKDATANSAQNQKLTKNKSTNINDETMDLLKKIDEMAPIMASASPREPIVHQLAVNHKEVKNKIDYNQIFLELFLDGGKKKYVTKPNLDPSKIPRNFWEAGEVRVKVIVNKSGKVENASILRGLNDIVDQVVLETVEGFEYQSGQINGQTVKFSTSEVFRFK
jgi:TonB family protein